MCYYVSSKRTWEFTESDATPVHLTTNVEGTTYSPYYDDFSVAARNHYYYRYHGITNFNDRYYLYEIQFRFFDEDLVLTVNNVGLHSGVI